MINLRSTDEIALMQASADITMACMAAIEQRIQPGVTTRELDKIVEDIMRERGGIPSFKGYNGYPASICASVNEAVVHGIPDKRRLRSGDIVGIDMGTIYKGYHSDMARTFIVGQANERVCELVECAKLCFDEAVKVMQPGNRLGDIGHAVQTTAESRGFSVVRDLCGHGIGTSMHEDPEVLNFGRRGRGLRIKPGMVLAVEPMINMGTYAVQQMSDGWTILTKDRKPSAHYENTVYISKDGPVILTDR